MVFHRPHSEWQKPGKGTEKLQPTTPTSGSYLTHTWVNVQQAGSDTFIIGGAEEETQRGGDRGASQSLEYLLWFFIDRIYQLTVYKVTHGQDKQSNKGQTHQALTPNCCDFQIQARTSWGRQAHKTHSTCAKEKLPSQAPMQCR